MGGGQKMSMDFTERAKNTRHPEFRQGELCENILFLCENILFPDLLIWWASGDLPSGMHDPR